MNVYYVEENVRTENCLNKILSDYKKFFKSEIGSLKGFEVEITVDPDCKPKFCKARPVSYALNERIEKQLERKMTSMSQFNILSGQPQLNLY